MRAAVLAVAVVLAAGCLPRHGQRCGDAAQALAKLGGCGMDLKSFVSDCQKLSTAEAEDGPEVVLTCVLRAKSCDEADACE